MPTYGRSVNRSHPHTLKLLIKEKAYYCDCCKEMGFGKRYSCPNEDCDFHIHKDCAEADDGTRHHLLKGHYLSLVASADGGDRYCDACGWDIKGCYYHSRRGDHDLHPCCALQTQKDKISNGRGVDLFLRKELSSECHLCELKKLSNGNKSWGYVYAADKKYQFHLYCVKKKLIDYKENIMLGAQNCDDHGESSALVLRVMNQPDQSQIVPRDNHVSGKVSPFKKMLCIVFDLIVAVLTGNPMGLIIDLGSFFIPP